MHALLSIVRALALLLLAIPSHCHKPGSTPPQLVLDAGQGHNGGALQPNVTWDKHSLFVNGKRILFLSGEFHPFRLPVPTLWLDVFQKIRALGFTGVSFYVDWALVEGKPGEINTSGVFALEPFFEAAKQAGIYLLARPGPYINAEVSGGGFPGWYQRIPGRLRTTEGGFLNHTELYVKTIGEIIARAQITHGGPVILYQPENEYSHWTNGAENSAEYWNHVKAQYRKAGIVVPFVSNDAGPDGNNAPGWDGGTDIYGHDGYPLGFDASHPDVWPDNALPTDWALRHQDQSPNTPYAIIEFQAGSFDPWGGPGFEKCNALTNSEFLRVFWKNLYSFGVTIYNAYMVYGGTNWGNLGHPGGYTSYDYGAAITEDRLVTREKYSEAKLQANFLVASPAYLTGVTSGPQKGAFVDTDDLTVTRLHSGHTSFLTVRHSNYASKDSTSYKLLLEGSSAGNITVPQSGGHLTLHGRDSKTHVVGYDAQGVEVVYSTAEVFTVQKHGDHVTLMVYGGPDEQHELLLGLAANDAMIKAASSQGMRAKVINGQTLISWETIDEDRVVGLSTFTLWVISRESAYKWWVLDVPAQGQSATPYVGQATHSLIIKGGYLLRTARIKGNYISLVGDLLESSTIQILAGAPNPLHGMLFNDKPVAYSQDINGIVTAELHYRPVELQIPDLSQQTWYYIDTLPEIHGGFDESAWVSATLDTTADDWRNLTTPMSLYSADYGYHAGTLEYRGRFTAAGNETKFSVDVQGGTAFGFSAWLDDHFLGSFTGSRGESSKELTFKLPKLKNDTDHVITLVMDNMGYNENFIVGQDDMKEPRGILDYNLHGRPQTCIQWRIAGNLGGEDYWDKLRGPLNEGGLWAERQGLHLPIIMTPHAPWTIIPKGPMTGTTEAGIAFYATKFDLNFPHGYDIPLAIELPSIDPDSKSTYRVQIYVNGWQFGKYIHHLGPQTKFPVPEGIWDYRGENWVVVSVWAMEEGGARVEGMRLVAGPVVQTGYGEVEVVGKAERLMGEESERRRR